MKLSSVVALAGFLAASEAAPSQQHFLRGRNPSKPPNFLFVLTDDQDLQLNSPAYMPKTLSRVKDKGVDYTNHFVTTSLCCPSRVSLWTGRQAHNTNVTDTDPPWGGYPKFVSQGFNDDWFPIWMQNAGYNTYYTGKVMNSHSVDTYNDPFMKGFNGSDFLLDPYTYSYYNSTYQRNHEPPKSYEGQHTTEVITEKGLGFLNDALKSDRPFFLTVAPIAPHANIDSSQLAGPGGVIMSPPIPVPGYRDLFQDAKIPRTPNFNPVNQTGVSWIKDLERQNETVVEYEDSFYRKRLQSLQSVDDLVEVLVDRLEESGDIDNTYIIFSSDNGYHLGQHRLPPSKYTGFEEDIRVPFFIRGPGIPEGESIDGVTTHIDLAPTFFDLAGIPLRKDFDGTPMPITQDTASIKHEHVAVEFWGDSGLEGKFSRLGPGGDTRMPNNSYKSARILGEDYNLYYAVWCTNEHELYDLSTDPYQTQNIYSAANATNDRYLGYSLQAVQNRLDALVLALQTCQGITCIKPWSVLHPDGS
ncbi:Arylsulfatase, partial [Aspergillus sp. HF37]